MQKKIEYMNPKMYLELNEILESHIIVTFEIHNEF